MSKPGTDDFSFIQTYPSKSPLETLPQIDQDASIYTQFIPFFGIGDENAMNAFIRIFTNHNIESDTILSISQSFLTSKLQWHPSGVFTILPTPSSFDNFISCNELLRSFYQLYDRLMIQKHGDAYKPVAKPLLSPESGSTEPEQLTDVVEDNDNVQFKKYIHDEDGTGQLIGGLLKQESDDKPTDMLTTRQFSLLFRHISQDYLGNGKFIYFGPEPIKVAIQNQPYILLHHPSIFTKSDTHNASSKLVSQTLFHYYPETTFQKATTFRLQFAPMNISRTQLSFVHSINDAFYKLPPSAPQLPMIGDIRNLGLGAREMTCSILYLDAFKPDSVHSLYSFILFSIRCQNARSTIFNQQAKLVIILQNDQYPDRDEMPFNEARIRSIIAQHLDIQVEIIHEGVTRDIDAPPPPIAESPEDRWNFYTADSSTSWKLGAPPKGVKFADMLAEAISLPLATKDDHSAAKSLSGVLCNALLVPIADELLFPLGTDEMTASNDISLHNVQWKSPVAVYKAPEYASLLASYQWENLDSANIIPLQLNSYAFEVEVNVESQDSYEWQYFEGGSRKTGALGESMSDYIQGCFSTTRFTNTSTLTNLISEVFVEVHQIPTDIHPNTLIPDDSDPSTSIETFFKPIQYIPTLHESPNAISSDPKYIQSYSPPFRTPFQHQFNPQIEKLHNLTTLTVTSASVLQSPETFSDSDSEAIPSPPQDKEINADSSQPPKLDQSTADYSMITYADHLKSKSLISRQKIASVLAQSNPATIFVETQSETKAKKPNPILIESLLNYDTLYDLEYRGPDTLEYQDNSKYAVDYMRANIVEKSADLDNTPKSDSAPHPSQVEVKIVSTPDLPIELKCPANSSELVKPVFFRSAPDPRQLYNHKPKFPLNQVLYITQYNEAYRFHPDHQQEQYQHCLKKLQDPLSFNSSSAQKTGAGTLDGKQPHHSAHGETKSTPLKRFDPETFSLPPVPHPSPTKVTSKFAISIYNRFRREIFSHHRFPHIEEMQTNPASFPCVTIVSVYNPSSPIISSASLSYDLRLIRRVLHTLDVNLPIFFVTILPNNFDPDTAPPPTINPKSDKPLLGWDFEFKPEKSTKGGGFFSGLMALFGGSSDSKRSNSARTPKTSGSGNNDATGSGDISLHRQLIVQRMKHLERLCLDPFLVTMDENQDDSILQDERFLEHKAGVWTTPQTNSSTNSLPPSEKAKLRPIYHLVVHGYKEYFNSLSFINRCSLAHFFRR